MTTTPAPTGLVEYLRRFAQRIPDGWICAERDRSTLIQAADEIERLRGELQRWRTAANTLADKVEECGHESAGIFQIAALHGFPYSGPNWVAELAAIRALNTPVGGEEK